MSVTIRRRGVVNSDVSGDVGGDASGCASDDYDLLARDRLLGIVLKTRGLCADDLDFSLSKLLPPDGLKGITDATARLYQALSNNHKILIVGDFDADGATSCALAIRAFNAFAYRNVQFLVPNRFEYGYGLTPEIVSLAQSMHPDLIITVDNGISSIDGVAFARQHGIDVIVTDHHLPGESLPNANAIVNPNQPGCTFASKNLAGVGVVFYVMVALRRLLIDNGWFEGRCEPPNMRQFLDLVALGTVADVVPLDTNNRILVQNGLAQIRRGLAIAGIRALLEVANKSAADLTSTDLGFALGPRLNAAGRLDDMSIGIACLITDDKSMARDIAIELDALNQERRQIEMSMQLSADAHLEQLNTIGNDALPNAICLYDPSWHQGVIGILASRIKERYHRPTICFAQATDDENNTIIKGSARSIDGLHIRDALDTVAAKHPQLISKFGGHAMAAGLSISVSDFDNFRQAFVEQVNRCLSEQDLEQTLWSDGALQDVAFGVDSAKRLRTAMPWGQKLPPPLFDDYFEIVQQRIVGSNHLKLRLKRFGEQRHEIDAIAFNIDLQNWPDLSVKKVHCVYQPDVNAYRGNETLQLLVRHMVKVA